ncbi:MAG: xylan 1,4-beta-xylosidase [Bacteroidales bacterium]|nr:xylan 1,4-beta-xylosidase [Bacteroidales bacterium]MBR4326300.1 xylan 1,4-beta-xylosidase [Bacteroidales bacterium]
MKKDRFIKVYSQNSLFGSNVRILVDVETGVNYLFCIEGYGGGLTVMLNADGKPIVWSKEEIRKAMER